MGPASDRLREPLLPRAAARGHCVLVLGHLAAAGSGAARSLLLEPAPRRCRAARGSAGRASWPAAFRLFPIRNMMLESCVCAEPGFGSLASCACGQQLQLAALERNQRALRALVT